MILLELNEFNPDLLGRAAHELDLPRLQSLLELPAATTTTPDRTERAGLDPWVQWVSIHTGVPSDRHGVAHLAEAHRLEVPQIWEVLDAHGISSGVWGAMNARRGTAADCRFFFPDPWTWTEHAHPDSLNGLLALPRYYAQNYLDLATWDLCLAGLKTTGFMLRPGSLRALLPAAGPALGTLARHGPGSHVLFALFDLVSTELFIAHCARHRPRFKVLFLNSIAHLQHHKWHEPDALSPEMVPVFRLLERMIGRLLDAFPETEPLVVVNAFSQKCTAHKNQYLYRQINPREFLRSAKVAFDRVEQMMTNDAHVFFATDDDAAHAAEILSASTVDGGRRLFEVTRRAAAPRELFYQVDFWEDVREGATITINDMTFPFASLFEKVVLRTGEHVPEGRLCARNLALPNTLPNHEIFQLIKSHYDIAA